MNSSEPLIPLTPHEEKLTAYLDGSLPPEDAAAFERDHPEAIALKTRQAGMTELLRAHSTSPVLRNGEFFNHQIVRQIQPPAPSPEKRAFFPLWRLAFASACCLLAAVAVFKTFVTVPAPDAPVPQYLAKVTSVRAGDHLLTAKLVPADGLVVVWVDGMDKLPTNYVLQ